MKIDILNTDGAVIFSHECEGNTVKLTVEAAVKAGVDLSYANLRRFIFNWDGARL